MIYTGSTLTQARRHNSLEQTRLSTMTIDMEHVLLRGSKQRFKLKFRNLLFCTLGMVLQLLVPAWGVLLKVPLILQLRGVKVQRIYERAQRHIIEGLSLLARLRHGSPS